LQGARRFTPCDDGRSTIKPRSTITISESALLSWTQVFEKLAGSWIGGKFGDALPQWVAVSAPVIILHLFLLLVGVAQLAVL
jgi:hypothetical protein